MGDLVPFRREFEGTALTCATYAGQPAFIAKEIGRVLGYADDGSRLVTKITAEWAPDFIEGQDFVKLEGAAFEAFRDGLGAPTGPVGAKVRHLTLLTESGVLMVCIKTDKEIGRRLRRWLVDEVLPSIGRTGTYTAPAAPAAGDARLALALRREDRLAERVRLDRSRLLLKLADRYHDRPQAARLLEALASETAAGRSLPALLPEATPTEETYLTPAEIAELATREGVEINANHIGHVIKTLGLRGGKHSKSLVRLITKPNGVTDERPAFSYDREATRLILEAARARYGERSEGPAGA